ncbi:phosphatidylinositol-glycan biosynthesis class X protein-like isoform X2 [Dreissena polymorpha]|uniref:phosphatidylinositol-glycan biosynthesis class X protein-like isoform X2 n=1 Tax=Dreissena polymorpha TaxID=45954 RepID=UPI0022641C87|nr:phosphatidylinositol-glycan biosynthesis class X protein-like isoform X2 [Dreissena polymorpha]
MTLIVLCLCFMVTIGTGDILPQLSSEITKLGFHREIHRKLTFPVALLPGLVPGGDVECHVMFDELIPAGAYMDPYQLENLRMFVGLNVEIHDQVDLEAPEFQSSAIHVSVFSNLSLIGDSWQAGYVFPVHIRYHGISDSSEFVRVKFITPSVAIRCQDTTYQMTFYGYGGPIHSQQSRLCSRGSPILCDWMFIQTEKDIRFWAGIKLRCSINWPGSCCK